MGMLDSFIDSRKYFVNVTKSELSVVLVILQHSDRDISVVAVNCMLLGRPDLLSSLHNV